MRVLLLCLLILFLSHAAWAKVVELFRQTQYGPRPVEDYAQRLDSVEDGDTLLFTDGQRFIVGPKIDEGKNTRIFSLANWPSEVLRVPLPGHGDSINESIDGYEILRHFDLPIVRVNQSLRSQYLVVDRVNPRHITCDRFIEDPSIPPGLRAEMAEKLVDFGKRFAMFSFVDDFHRGQIVYDPDAKRWILLDWMGGRVFGFRYQGGRLVPKESTIFSHGFFDKYVLHTKPREPKYQWVAALERRIQSEIEAERARIHVAGAHPRKMMELLEAPEAAVPPATRAPLSEESCERKMIRRLWNQLYRR